MSVLDELEPSGLVRVARIDQILVGENIRDLDESVVRALVDSIAASGALLQPVAVDEHLVLIDGEHRLEACRRLGWSEIEVKVLADVGTAETRSMLQFMANAVRARLTIRDAAHWFPQYRAFVAADRRRKAVSGTGVASSVTAPDGTAVSLDDVGAASGETRDVIAATLGYSEVDLDRYRQIEEIATRVDDSLRDAAARGLELIDAGKPVTTVWNALVAQRDREEADPAALLREQRTAEAKARWTKLEGFLTLCNGLVLGDLLPAGGSPEETVLVLRDVVSAAQRLLERCEGETGLGGASDDELAGGQRYAHV